MIALTDIDGRSVHLHPDAIASVTEAGASSQWHGVKAYVRTFDGKTIEAQQSASEIARKVDAERRAAP